MTTIDIGYKTFAIDRKAIGHVYTGKRTIWDAYRRPSFNKERIWNEWARWADEVGARICIESANSQIFTISGSVVVDDIPYFIYVTPTYWRVYPV